MRFMETWMSVCHSWTDTHVCHMNGTLVVAHTEHLTFLDAESFQELLEVHESMGLGRLLLAGVC